MSKLCIPVIRSVLKRVRSSGSPWQQQDVLLPWQHKAANIHLSACLLSASNHPDTGVPHRTTLKDADRTVNIALPNHADVVVVGGGAVGCSTLYFLTKMGVNSPILLEKDQLTAGTTWHSAGMLWQLPPTDIEMSLTQITRNTVKALDAETGMHGGWLENGGLWVAPTKERLEAYKRLMTLGRAFGMESFLLSPEETKKLYPLMKVDDLYGALYSPQDGTIDPASYCMALARAATNNGAKIFTGCSVEGITVKETDFGQRHVTSIQTRLGTVKCDKIINCTGVWAPRLGRMAGVSVPQCAMKHAYVVSDRIEGIQNMPNCRDHDASVYLRLQGDAISIGGYEANPVFWDDVKPDFAFSLFDLDWDVFGAHIEGAVNRVPALGETGIKSTVCGPESFTPDHKPILGEDPEVRGFIHGSGFNSGGLMLSGCGHELAHWAVHGRPSKDMTAFDIRRFSSKMTSNQEWIRERSHESYAKSYSISYPHDEPLASRNMRKGPLHKVLLGAGCMYQERQGWERPGWFSLDGPAPVLPYDYYGNYGYSPHEDYSYCERLQKEYTHDFPAHHKTIGEECRACRERVAVFDMSYFGKMYISGPDSQKAVDWLFTNDMHKPEGRTIYTCMLNQYGGIEADLTVSTLSSGNGNPHDPEFSTDRGFYVAVGGGFTQHVFTHIRNVTLEKGFHVTLDDVSEQMGMISVQGPNSRQVLQSLTEADLSDASFPHSSHKVVSIAGHELRALRMSFVGELGWELHTPWDSCVPVYQAVMDRGQQFGIVNAGYRALDSLSLEVGYPLWHHDIRMEDMPMEVGLAFTCKLKSPVSFLGRDALEKQREDIPRKKRVGFVLDSPHPLHGMETLWRNDQAVGYIRRADYSHTVEKSIAYACFHPSAGTPVTKAYIRDGNYLIESLGARVPAKPLTGSAVKPYNKRTSS